MAYEVGWTRLLATQLGSSTYAFTLMLATFLTGIVLGSAAFEWWTRRHPAKRSVFALTQTLTALTSLACLVAFPFLPQLLPMILKATHESFRGLVLAQLTIAALAMLPVAVVFGFNFPVPVSAARRRPKRQPFCQCRPRLRLEHARRDRRRRHCRLHLIAGAGKLSNASCDRRCQSGSRRAAVHHSVAPPDPRRCSERSAAGRSRRGWFLPLLL